MDPVRTFDSLCAGLQSAATVSSSLKQLEELRATPGTLHILRSVLESAGVSSVTMMHAATMLKDVLVREWPALQPQDKVALQTWCIVRASDLYNRGGPPIAGQLLLAAAVATKRGWFEAPSDARAAPILRVVLELFSSGAAKNWLAARLVLLLVQVKGCSQNRSAELVLLESIRHLVFVITGV
jgi:hypothetical protein